MKRYLILLAVFFVHSVQAQNVYRLFEAPLTSKEYLDSLKRKHVDTTLYLVLVNKTEISDTVKYAIFWRKKNECWLTLYSKNDYKILTKPTQDVFDYYFNDTKNINIQPEEKSDIALLDSAGHIRGWANLFIQTYTIVLRAGRKIELNVPDNPSGYRTAAVYKWLAILANRIEKAEVID
ncbi:MAG: hypothetical protein H0X33_03495 [Taibaiella sp.]|nr:hypothetical protein [Taibaiella sp.]